MMKYHLNNQEYNTPRLRIVYGGEFECLWRGIRMSMEGNSSIITTFQVVIESLLSTMIIYFNDVWRYRITQRIPLHTKPTSTLHCFRTVLTEMFSVVYKMVSLHTKVIYDIREYGYPVILKCYPCSLQNLWQT